MGQAIVKTPFLALGNDLRYLLVSLPQEIKDFSYNLKLLWGRGSLL